MRNRPPQRQLALSTDLLSPHHPMLRCRLPPMPAKITVVGKSAASHRHTAPIKGGRQSSPSSPRARAPPSPLHPHSPLPPPLCFAPTPLPLPCSATPPEAECPSCLCLMEPRAVEHPGRRPAFPSALPTPSRPLSLSHPCRSSRLRPRRRRLATQPLSASPSLFCQRFLSPCRAPPGTITAAVTGALLLRLALPLPSLLPSLPLSVLSHSFVDRVDGDEDGPTCPRHPRPPATSPGQMRERHLAPWAPHGSDQTPSLFCEDMCT